MSTIAIKIRFEDVLRRFRVPSDSPDILDYARFEHRVRSLIQVQESSKHVLITYVDDEGDRVLMSSNEELAEAVQICTNQLLRLQVSVEENVNFTENHRNQNQNQNEEDEEEADEEERKHAELIYCEREELRKQRRMQKFADRQQRLAEREQQQCQETDCNDIGNGHHRHHHFHGHRHQSHDRHNQHGRGGGGHARFHQQQHHRRFQRGGRGHVRLHMAPGFTPPMPNDEDEAIASAQRERRQPQPKAYMARFVKHVTAPDGAEYSPGSRFDKVWRLRNEGTETWPAHSTCLIFVSKKRGDQIGAPDSVALESSVAPSDHVDVRVPMRAPDAPGTYCGFWKMAICSASSSKPTRKFGQRIWVRIQVAAPASSPSSSSPHLEFEAQSVAPAAASPVSSLAELRYTEQLAQLASMGFSSEHETLPLLTRFDGNMTAVIGVLVRRRVQQ
jgi:Ig-like domain from next to BRCA1 gene/PB1 domain